MIGLSGLHFSDSIYLSLYSCRRSTLVTVLPSMMMIDPESPGKTGVVSTCKCKDWTRKSTWKSVAHVERGKF